jgi:hypothetical protein
LPKYWQPDHKLFAFVLDEKGRYLVGTESNNYELAVTCLPNLFGLSWVSARDKNPWKIINEAGFEPDRGDAPQASVEWWYMAARHAGTDQEVERFKILMLREMISYKDRKVYLQRPAVLVLALLENSDWIYSINKMIDIK